MQHVQKYLKGYKNKEITNTNVIRDIHFTKMFQKYLKCYVIYMAKTFVYYFPLRMYVK